MRMTLRDGQCMVDEWDMSGMSVATFCASRGIGVSRFRYWQRRVREAHGSPEPELVELVANGQHGAGVYAPGVRDTHAVDRSSGSDSDSDSEVRLIHHGRGVEVALSGSSVERALSLVEVFLRC